MKTRFLKGGGGNSSLGLFLAPTTLLVLAVLVAKADSSFTATGYLYQVPATGISVTNPVGQAMLRGNVHVMAMQASDPRMTGRLQAGLDLAWQKDGTALGGGSSYLEIGTFENQTNFTPSGGLWVLSYRGVVQADGSDQLTIAGYGVGGGIEGLRTEASATRAAGPILDPTIPYQVSGVIKAAPVIATNTINLTEAGGWPNPPPTGSIAITNSQLTLRILSPRVSTNLNDNWVLTGPFTPWSATQGQTFEARVRLLGLNHPSVDAVLSLWNNFGLGYAVWMNRDYIALGKYVSPGLIIFRSEKVAARDNNVVLALALTPAGNNVTLTGRALDVESGEVISEIAVQDTPDAEPTLTADEFYRTTGMGLSNLTPDPAGQPWTSGIALGLMVEQCYTNASLPAGQATFADFQLRICDVPPLGVTRAVQISAPCPAGVSYYLESAPTPNGPWLPLNLETPPGIKSFTVPAMKGSEFFRPQLAP